MNDNIEIYVNEEGPIEYICGFCDYKTDDINLMFKHLAIHGCN